MWLLTVEDDEGSATHHRLVRDTYRFGRALENEIVLEQNNISRHHATFERTEKNLWMLIDQDSTNGCYVNGERVQNRTILSSLDTVQLGDYRLTLRSDGINTNVPTPPPKMVHPARLVVMTGLGANTVCVLKPRQRIKIGHQDDCELRLLDAGVDSIHALVEPLPNGRHEIVDYGSKNGLLINTQRYQRKVLEGGDTLEVCTDVRVRFFDVKQLPDPRYDTPTPPIPLVLERRATLKPRDQLQDPAQPNAGGPPKRRTLAGGVDRAAAVAPEVLATTPRPPIVVPTLAAQLRGGDVSEALIPQPLLPADEPLPVVVASVPLGVPRAPLPSADAVSLAEADGNEQKGATMGTPHEPSPEVADDTKGDATLSAAEPKPAAKPETAAIALAPTVEVVAPAPAEPAPLAAAKSNDVPAARTLVSAGVVKPVAAAKSDAVAPPAAPIENALPPSMRPTEDPPPAEPARKPFKMDSYDAEVLAAIKADQRDSSHTVVFEPLVLIDEPEPDDEPERHPLAHLHEEATATRGVMIETGAFSTVPPHVRWQTPATRDSSPQGSLKHSLLGLAIFSMVVLTGVVVWMLRGLLDDASRQAGAGGSAVMGAAAAPVQPSASASIRPLESSERLPQPVASSIPSANRRVDPTSLPNTTPPPSSRPRAPGAKPSLPKGETNNADPHSSNCQEWGNCRDK